MIAFSINLYIYNNDNYDINLIEKYNSIYYENLRKK